MSLKDLFRRRSSKHSIGDKVINSDELTLQKVCDALQIELPSELAAMAVKSYRIAFKPAHVKEGDIYLCIKAPEDLYIKNKDTLDYYQMAVDRGAAIVIMDKKRCREKNVPTDGIPVIMLDDTTRQVKHFFDCIRRAYDAKVVMITGSVGKTTTKDLCYAITRDSYNTYASEKNGNTIYRSANHMFRKYGKEGNELLIQESGAGRRGSVRLASEMLTPDIFVLTNVYKHHFQVYKTMERLFEDKTSPDDNVRGDGVVITNFDDEKIRAHHFKHRVISFAVDYEDVDYRAINIKQEVEFLTFDIYERATDTTIPIKVRLLGTHNAYNATAAFIVARTLGIPADVIQTRMMDFHTEGVRQNLQNVGGVYIDMDCYNVAEESIMTMLKSGETFPVDDESRRIALIGGENKLGADVRERSLAFGEKLGEIKFDSFLLCGTDSEKSADLNKYGAAKSIYNGFTRVTDTDCSLSTCMEDMEAYLRSNVSAGDLLMVKGIYYLDMSIAVDRVFGTSYSFGLNYYQKEMVGVASDGFTADLLPRFGALELTGVTATDGILTIPDALDGHPVFRIKEGAVDACRDIKRLSLGSGIRNIGARAFADCTSLEEVVIPDSVSVIEDGAFSGCTSLKRVVLGANTTHIGAGAFAGCTSLERVSVPDTVGCIGDGAFPSGVDCVIVCNDGSFAFDYAADHTIRFELN